MSLPSRRQPTRRMAQPAQPAAESARQSSILDREAGLRRELTPRQLAMIALGGAIGTGLFLGSAVSVRLAGPGVILSYTAGAVIALAIAWALAEMAVAHPSPDRSASTPKCTCIPGQALRCATPTGWARLSRSEAKSSPPRFTAASGFRRFPPGSGSPASRRR